MRCVITPVIAVHSYSPAALQSIGEGCNSPGLFDRYDFPNHIAAESCAQWAEAAGEDLLEEVLAKSVKTVLKLPGPQRILNVTALKHEVCFGKSEVCRGLPSVNATFAPPLYGAEAAGDVQRKDIHVHYPDL